MKRLMPSSLITFLQANPQCLRADCFAITLPNGQTIHATEGQWEITFLANTPGWSGGQTTFKAMQYARWSRGPITSEAGFKMSANTMTLDCVVQQGTQFPGLPIGILNAALNHLFDGCPIWVYTAYMPIGQYGNVSAGIETKFQGTILRRTNIGRASVQFQAADPLYLLNMKVPARLLQSGCPWGFADQNCKLNGALFTVSFTAGSGSNQTVLVPSSAFSQANGYFTQGVVTCTSGNNAGLSQTVKVHASGQLTTMVPWLLPVQVGDTFSAIKGCDKTLTMCKASVEAGGTVVDNSINNGGTPFMPPPSTGI